MSPTSYQAAPPRRTTIAEARSSVKFRAAAAKELAEWMGNRYLKSLDELARLRSFARKRRGLRMTGLLRGALKIAGPNTGHYKGGKRPSQRRVPGWAPWTPLPRNSGQPGGRYQSGCVDPPFAGDKKGATKEGITRWCRRCRRGRASGSRSGHRRRRYWFDPG